MSNFEERFQIMQQQMEAMQQLLQSFCQPQQQASAQSMDTNDNAATQLAVDTASLHSFAVRPSYEWTPSDFLQQQLGLDRPLHTSPLMDEDQRKKLIESYPGISGLDYKAPATLPIAEKKMNRGQQHEDRSLRNFQYLLSAIFRPLDIFAHELATTERENPNLERYFAIIADIRNLLLHACSSLTQARNDIAFRAFNPGFTASTGSAQTFTMPAADFQASLVQQHATTKALRDATARKPKRPFGHNSHASPSALSAGDTPQFFRFGPSSQQGGHFNNGNAANNRPHHHNNHSNAGNHHNNHNKRGNNYNPFKQQNQH